MRRFKRMISLMLLLGMLLQAGSLSVSASETTLPTEILETTVQTEPPETEEVSEETEPPETIGETEEDPESQFSQSSSMSFGTSGYTEQPGAVPLYLQTDYPNVPYGSGTLATSGCTMTCVAMVATYLSGQECLPDALSRRFRKYDASHLQRLEAASTVLDLVYTKTTSWQDVEDALVSGKVVIIMLGKPSQFTKSQHTVVLTGITKDGSILVNDPYGPNYRKPELKDGFLHGFPPQMLRTGFGQAWIYEGYEPTVLTDSRYPDMELTEEDKDLIASVIWLEARGESFEGQQAIAEIILNRLSSGEFSDTVSGTILAENQFRTAKFLDDAQPGALQYKAIEKALAGPNVLPMDVYYFARSAPTENVWGRIGGHVFCYDE